MREIISAVLKITKRTVVSGHIQILLPTNYVDIPVDKMHIYLEPNKYHVFFLFKRYHAFSSWPSLEFDSSDFKALAF